MPRNYYKGPEDEDVATCRGCLEEPNGGGLGCQKQERVAGEERNGISDYRIGSDFLNKLLIIKLISQDSKGQGENH